MENDNPSIETREAIKEGVTWLANWYADRCNAGVISSAEYEAAINKLQNVKIYTTRQGSNRVTEELEKGNLHFKSKLLDQGATVDKWKKLMAKKNVFPIGWCPKANIEEAVIIIDIDKIKEELGNDPKEITSTVIHELTHLTADVFDAEQDVKKIIEGRGNNGDEKRIYNLNYNKKVEYVAIEPNIITDTDTALVIPENNNAETIRNSDTNAHPSFMKENVFYNEYLDKENEIYARIMQVRYRNGLKAGESIPEEDIKNMEYDRNVINRYELPIIKSVLNDVAHVPTEYRMKKDAELACSYRSMPEKLFPVKQNQNKAESKPNNINGILSGKNDRYFS